MSSGVWSLIFIAGFLITLFVLTNFSGKLPLGRSRYLVPGLKKRSTGPKCGTYSIKFYPDQETLVVQTALQGGGQTSDDLANGYAKIVTFFLSFQLFYYGSGSREHDTSGPLREQVRAVLNNRDEPTWKIIEGDSEDLNNKPLFRYDGELFRNALAVPSVLGSEPRAKNLALVQGVKALVGYLVNQTPHLTGAPTSAQARLVRHAVTQLLDWHDQFGPPSDRGEVQDRAAHAWEAALGSVRGTAA